MAVGHSCEYIERISASPFSLGGPLSIGDSLCVWAAAGAGPVNLKGVVAAGDNSHPPPHLHQGLKGVSCQELIRQGLNGARAGLCLWPEGLLDGIY